jgi:hypothetical protein
MRMLIGLFLMLAADSAAGLTLTPLSDGRKVYAEFCVSPSGCSTSLTPPTPFQAWTGSALGASQTSSVDALGMGGNGSATGGSTTSPIEALSTFNVTFSIDSAADFELSGTVAASIRPQQQQSVASAQALLLRADASTVIGYTAGLGQTVNFDYHGYLDPGTYQIDVSAGSFFATPASWSFRLDLAPAPEPALLGLVAAAGLLPLARRRAR